MQLWVGTSLEEGLFVCLFTLKMVLEYLKIVIPFVKTPSALSSP